MKYFLLLILIFIEFFGFKYIWAVSVWYFILYNIFICVNFASLLKSLHYRSLKNNLLIFYVTLTWTIDNALCFAHAALVEMKSGHLMEYGYEIYILLILSSVIMAVGMHTAKNLVKSDFAPLRAFKLTPIAMYILICTNLALDLYKIHVAGGLMAFIYAPYGAKVDNSLLTFFNLFGNILSFTSYFILPFIFGKHGKKVKLIATLFYIYKMVFGALNGSSGSLFSPILALFIFAIFTLKNKADKQKLKRYVILAAIPGIIIGMFIRQNRKAVEDAKLSDFRITTAIDEIMQSATFDCIVNINSVIKALPPTYTPSQFIYPYIHYIPRSVFHWKPMELGRVVGMEFVGTTEDSFAGFIPSPIGEFYYDFGILGVVSGMLFVGISMGYLQEKLNRTRLRHGKDNSHIWALTIAVTSSSSMIYAWYTGCYCRYIDLVVIVLIIRLLQSNTNKQNA